MAAPNKVIISSDDSPAVDAVAVTPSDTVDLPNAGAGYGPCRALYIGVSGDVTVQTQNGGGVASVTFKSVPIGILPVRCSRVMATNTTATNIVALY